MANSVTLVVDIETVAQDLTQLPERAVEILLDVDKEEDRQRIREHLGLDPCTGRVICIGVHWLEVDRYRAYCQPEERELLANFWSDLGQIRPQRFVTFNGKAFDFPYVNIRSAITRVPAHRDILLDTRRFSNDRHFDVREVLTNYDRYKKGTLEFFCEIFGIPSPKNGINGSQVEDYFRRGRLDDIAQYCLADCRATGELYLRLRSYYR